MRRHCYPLLRFLVLSIIVLTLAATLASSRVLSRLGSLASHFRFQSPHLKVLQRPLMTSNMVPDRYRNPPQAPPVFTIGAEQIVDETKKICDTTKSILDKVVADVSPEKATFDNVLEPILIDDNKSSTRSRILTFFQHVSTDAALREASTEAEKIFDDFGIECKMREDVFKVVDGAYGSRAEQKLDKEPLHILEKERKGYIKNGLRLPAGAQRDRFKEIKKRLSQLAIQAQKNLNEEKGSIWFTPEELDGVPPDDIDIDSLEKGTGENEGKVKLTFKYNHYFPLIKHCKVAETRKQYTIAEANKVCITLLSLKPTLNCRRRMSMSQSSRKSSNFATRLHVFLDTPITPVLRSRTRWLRPLRMSMFS